MASRDFIRRIPRKIEEVSGEEPIFLPKTLPKEVWFSSHDLARERGTGPIDYSPSNSRADKEYGNY